MFLEMLERILLQKCLINKYFACFECPVTHLHASEIKHRFSYSYGGTNI